MFKKFLGRGFIVECDLLYPPDIREESKNFPFAPYKSKIARDKLSTSQIEQYELINGRDCPEISPNEKMIADYSPRNNYIVHRSHLARLISYGMIVTRVHRAVVFDERDYMAEWVKLCTQKRAQAKAAGLESLSLCYKLMVSVCMYKSKYSLKLVYCFR